jgi:hypothetical protein
VCVCKIDNTELISGSHEVIAGREAAQSQLHAPDQTC